MNRDIKWEPFVKTGGFLGVDLSAGGRLGQGRALLGRKAGRGNRKNVVIKQNKT